MSSVVYKEYSLAVVISETHTVEIDGLGELCTRAFYRHLKDNGIEVRLYEQEITVL